VLETAYPTNALFLTDQRYLVTAQLVSVRSTTRRCPGRQPTEPNVPIPAALSAEVYARDQRSPLGTLSLAGTPSTSWEQDDGPVRLEGDVLTSTSVPSAQPSRAKARGGWR